MCKENLSLIDDDANLACGHNEQLFSLNGSVRRHFV